MEKETIVTDVALVDESTGVVETSPDCEVVPLEITVKRNLVTSNGRKFDAYEVKLVLPTYRDGKFIGDQLRRLPLYFGDDAFKTDNASSLTSEKDLKSGTLYVKMGGLSPIFSYREHTVDGKILPEPNAKGKKPAFWVNYGIVAFVKTMSNRSIFNVDGYRAKKQAQIDAPEIEAEPAEAAEFEDKEN